MALRHFSLVHDDEYTDDTIPLTLEKDVVEPTFQTELVSYLKSVFRRMFKPNDWFMAVNLALYPRNPQDRYDHIDPDLAVFIGLPRPRRNVKSWRINDTDHPAPTVVFEVASEGTWRNDLDDKPLDYARIGVREYYAYDPNEPRLWENTDLRLREWQITGSEVEERRPDARPPMERRAEQLPCARWRISASNRPQRQQTFERRRGRRPFA